MTATLSHPPATESGVVENDGVRIAWRSYGSGPPVLLIMGFMGSGRAWFRLLPHLRGYRAITFDNRGTGESDRPGGFWSMKDLAGDALAVLEDAGEERAHVVGASMGGMIAQHVALDHPRRVRCLVLCCTHPGSRPGPPPVRMMASLALRPLLGPAGTFGMVAPLLYSARTRRERHDLLEEDLALRFSDATPVATAPAQMAAIARHNTRSRLRELRMPTLVIHGEEDSLVPPEQGHELARRIPGARLVLVPECGHILTTDAEGPVSTALVEFLDSCG